jgi:octaprenyl-diphosphate synthase
LAGDYLYSKAFFVLAKNLDSRIMQVLASAVNKICEGEIEQLRNCYNPRLEEAHYLNIVKNKTGTLISACCETGAIVGGAQDEEIAALSHFGLNLGIAYQIVDDCLDLVKNESELGKEVRNDLKKGKITLPLIYTLRRLSEKGIKPDPFDMDKEKLIELCRDYKAVDYSINRARDFVKSAKEGLQILPDSKLKEMFKVIAERIVEKV